MQLLTIAAIALLSKLFPSNSHYETNFGASSAEGAGSTKIGFLKARQRRAFKKPIFIIRIAGFFLQI
jgi:uncharacterized membrane protein YjjB (DUF3815 family)